ASCCGLIVNEILTNSLKYAFPNGKTGNIYIYLKNENGFCCLILKDDGIGSPATVSETNGKSLGTQLIYNLSYQINARIDQANENGTQYTIRFKID
ncbi:MAG: sensor histidine kinase, partial [Bacteroidota bacterium]